MNESDNIDVKETAHLLRHSLTQLQSTELITALDEKEEFLEKLVRIQDWSFTDEFKNGCTFKPHEIREFVRDKDKVLITVMENGILCGFVMAEPYRSAFEYMLAYDKRMETPSGEDHKYYVSTIVVPPSRRKKLDYFILVRALVEELVVKRDIRNLTMHAKKSNRYSARIQKFSESSEVKRTIHNFMGTGESFDFIEMTVSNKDIERFDNLFLSQRRTIVNHKACSNQGISGGGGSTGR